MADTARPDPFTDAISLVAGPITAVIRQFDQLRRGAEELLNGFENFNKTMANLNETAARVNRLLNDFEEPIRAMLPQITRTVKLADDMAARLSMPIDQVVPGLNRLAATLDSPVLRSMPTDLGQFMAIVNDLGRRMSPLTQIAEQAGGFFGLRMPGFGGGSSSTATATPAPPVAARSTPAAAERSTPARLPAKRAPAKRRAGKKAASKKAAAKKRSA